MAHYKGRVWIINQYAATPNYGVAGRHYYIGKELVKMGYEVCVFSSAQTHLLRSLPSIEGQFKIEDSEGLRFYWLKMPFYAHAHSKMRIRNWFLFPLKIIFLAKKIASKPDAIVYSSPSLVGFLGAELLSKIYGCRLIFEVRDIWPLTFCEIGGYTGNNPFIRFLQWVEDRAYRVSDAVVSNLVNSVDHMVSRGMDRRKFNWIPNGFLKEEAENPEPLDLLIKKEIPVGKFVVGYAGTLGAANALYSFLDAAKMLESRGVEFVIAGGGKEEKALFAYAQQHEIKNVRFLGVVAKSQVQSLLKCFDVCYIGLSNDPLFRFGVSPNKLFDYFSASKPVIYAIDSGEYSPVTSAEAGLHIRPEDPEAIAEAVNLLKSLPRAQLEKMGDNGRKFAAHNHEYHSLAEKMSRVIWDGVDD